MVPFRNHDRAQAWDPIEAPFGKLTEPQAQAHDVVSKRPTVLGEEGIFDG